MQHDLWRGIIDLRTGAEMPGDSWTDSMMGGAVFPLLVCRTAHHHSGVG